MIPRWMHHAYASAFGYFWEPCPLCGRKFGGHEWREIDGKECVIPTSEPGIGEGICPDCTRAGRGRDPGYLGMRITGSNESGE